MRPTDAPTRRALLAAAVASPLATWWRAAPAASPIEDAFDQLVRKRGFGPNGPGLAVLVRRPGRVVLRRCAGLARLGDQAPVTPRTTFELASVSKTFTATAVLILHDRGKLSVEDDVRKHVPELPAYAGGRPITLADLLRHTSGLPDYMSLDEPPAGPKGYRTNEDYAGEFARQRAAFPLAFPTGQRYEYNNTNYMLLGLVVARVVKKSFGTFLRDEVFGPAGMAHSFVYESPDATPEKPADGCRPAVGYEWRRKKGAWEEAWGAPPVRAETMLTVGDGGVWTNLEDMARWDDAVRGNKLVKPATMQTALTPSRTRDGKTNTYGLGWDLYPDGAGGLTGYGHEGSWGGFRTSYYRHLASGRTTVVLSNRGDFDPDEFWYALDGLVEEHKTDK
ncbi:MAG: pbpE 1 [Gemmataceae bacterium]|nr:pbpE 1 [Gemmataceae bacterium]